MIMPSTAHPDWNPWANDRRLLELYRRRCRQEVEEMTCAAQAAEILKERGVRGESLLDAGCGGGYYHWSFQKRGLDLCYNGLDYTPQMIELAREEMGRLAGLDPRAFILDAIENLEQSFDNILCFNVLTNSPHYALPLECLLRHAKKRILIRENLGPSLRVHYSPDRNLDPGKQHIQVYHNTYPVGEVTAMMEGMGFQVSEIEDRRTGGVPELVCEVPHTWRILLGERKG